MAFTLYEAGLCSQCGYPLSVCRDPHADFEAVEDTCQATASIDEHRQATAKQDPPPGLVLSARLDDTPSVAKPPWEA